MIPVRYYFAINIEANIGENLAYANENNDENRMRFNPFASDDLAGGLADDLA